jgi:hypothetical protein
MVIAIAMKFSLAPMKMRNLTRMKTRASMRVVLWHVYLTEQTNSQAAQIRR